MAAFLLIWWTVLAAPLIAYLGLPGIRRSSPHAQILVVTAAAAFLLVAMGFVVLKLSFTNVWANVGAAVLAYFSYCLLAAACWRIPPKVIRYFAGLVAAVPIAVGYLSGTIGFLGVGWIAAEYTDPPQRVERMAPDLVCEVRGWGTIFSGGYKVQLFKRWSALPFIERRLVELTVDQNAAGADKTCADALRVYTQG